MKKIHQSLRGRYWIAILCGTVLGAIGGFFGFKSQQPLYRGEGLIQIAFIKPIVMQQSDLNGAMLQFEEYLQTQAMMMTSRRIIDNAIAQPDWAETKMPASPQTLQVIHPKIAANLSVEHPSRTELIRVYYTDRDPGVACAVVKSVVKSYQEFYNSQTKSQDLSRITALDRKRMDVQAKIAQLDFSIMGIAEKLGTTNLDALIEAKLAEEQKLEAALNQAELARDIAVSKKDARAGLGELTENQIAMIDQTMRGLIIDRNQIQNSISAMEARGVLPENAQMKQLLKLRELKNGEIAKYAAEWREMQIKVAEDPSLARSGISQFLPMSIKVLDAEVATLRKKFDQIKQERTEIGRANLKMQDFQRQREELNKDRGDVQRRIDQLAIENGVASRLQIISEGNVPITPYKDRRKMFGAAGALGGFGLPLAFLVFIGLLDKRFRFSDEANDGINNVPLLGILPRLPDHLTDPEQAAIAAHCIHQIRIMLQVGANPDKRRVFMVTSASTGDGKTSLTMALGLSFAASGSKTLVVDCDMVGQGLTHRLKAENVPGLIETLNLGTLRGHVRKTATKGLYVLPIGSADAVHAGVLSPQSIKRLLAACREHFDVVIIDTGPILGSLEASIVATEADGVIMAVARGQNQTLVEKAIKHLRSIGANMFGIVFNRAEQRDFQRSVMSASIRSISAKPIEQRPLLPETDESARFGPLARSVASCLPAGSHNGNGNGHHAGELPL
jgi:capsular exopolysaccharide synthesis family protein